MKLTQVLWHQHIGRMIKRHWWVQGQRKVERTSAEKYLKLKGIEVQDPKLVVNPPKVFQRLEIWDTVPKPQPLDETHPDWNEIPCLKYGNNNLLVYGTEQAQVLTKTEYIPDGLPEKYEKLVEQPSQKTEDLIRRIIRSSHIFDAHQEKLPKLKDPLRPAYNFARVYGITDVRKTHNFLQKLIQVCELMSDPILAQQRKIINNGQVRTYIEKDGDLLYFESSLDTMIMSNKLLTPLCSPSKTFDTPLPIISPLLPTIGLEPENIYNLQDHYPVASGSPWLNPHTIFINYDAQEVKNKTGLAVKETQILAHALVKCFATAACCAKQKYGEGIMDLPEPITIQCVQSNSKWFHFSVYQLNTLNLSGEEGTRNVWWSMPCVDLYEKAEYINAVPTLQGYNPEVYKQILAFYRNV